MTLWRDHGTSQSKGNHMAASMQTAMAAPFPSKSELMRELAPFAKLRTSTGMIIFVEQMVLYWGAIAVILFAPSLPLKIVASIFAGIKMTAFYSLGHDAGHRALVANRTLNWWISELFSVFAWQNNRLWVHDHQVLHHPLANGDHPDFYQPFSKPAFDALSPSRKLLERFIRAPNFLGFGINFLFFWLPTRLIPSAKTPARDVAPAWRFLVVIIAYQALFLTALSLAPSFAPITLLQSLLLAFCIPMLIYAMVTGGSLYLLHTHERLPWFKGDMERKGMYAPELCALHLTLPDRIHKAIHNTFAHSVHHAHPGIPPYNLLDAQKHFDKLMGKRTVVVPLTLGNAIRTLQSCKLYDYDRHQWLDFDGKPTTGMIDLEMRGA